MSNPTPTWRWICCRNNEVSQAVQSLLISIYFKNMVSMKGFVANLSAKIYHSCQITWSNSTLLHKSSGLIDVWLNRDNVLDSIKETKCIYTGKLPWSKCFYSCWCPRCRHQQATFTRGYLRILDELSAVYVFRDITNAFGNAETACIQSRLLMPSLCPVPVTIVNTGQCYG